MNAFLFNYQCFHNKRKYAKSGIVPFKHMTFAILIFEKDALWPASISRDKNFTQRGDQIICFFEAIASSQNHI